MYTHREEGCTLANVHPSGGGGVLINYLQEELFFFPHNTMRQWPKHGEEALANTLQILRGLGNTPLSRGEAEGQGGIA